MRKFSVRSMSSLVRGSKIGFLNPASRHCLYGFIPPSRHFQIIIRIQNATCCLNPASRQQFQNYPIPIPHAKILSTRIPPQYFSCASSRLDFMPHPASRIPHPATHKTYIGPSGNTPSHGANARFPFHNLHDV